MKLLRDLALAVMSGFLFRLNQYIGRRLRHKIVFHPETQRLIDAGRPVLYALWHGETFLPLYVKQKSQAVLLASSAVWRGDVFSGWAKRLGYEVINIPGFGEGKKWIAGSLRMVRALSRGREGAVVVDGPTGPNHEVKPGVFFLSQRSGVPVVPSGVAVSRSVRFFWRWDKYLLPLPGARAVLYGGAPLYLPPEAKLTEIPRLAQELAAAIDEAGRQADKILKRSPEKDFTRLETGQPKKPGGLR